jgi:hypothetical protein
MSNDVPPPENDAPRIAGQNLADDPDWPLFVQSYPGWSGIVNATLSYLVRECQSVRIVQFKEKFGTIRLYLEGEPEDIASADFAVRALETMSNFMCEQCGQPGRPRQGGWVRTLCDGCHRPR